MALGTEGIKSPCPFKKRRRLTEGEKDNPGKERTVSPLSYTLPSLYKSYWHCVGEFRFHGFPLPKQLNLQPKGQKEVPLTKPFSKHSAPHLPPPPQPGLPAALPEAIHFSWHTGLAVAVKDLSGIGLRACPGLSRRRAGGTDTVSGEEEQ